jgi:hypothetical protein
MQSYGGCFQGNLVEIWREAGGAIRKDREGIEGSTTSYLFGMCSTYCAFLVTDYRIGE